MVMEHSANTPNKPLVYGAAITATVVCALVHLALTRLIGDNAVPFITFLPAVLFSAWYGGFRSGALSVAISALAADYYFVDPRHSFFISNPADQISLLIFVVVGLGMTLLGDLHWRAVERADREALLRRDVEIAERAYRQRFETTLASIGDAVITTDAGGQVSFINEVASSLIGS